MLESTNAVSQLPASAGGADDLQGDEHSRQEVLKALELLGSPGPVEEVCSRQGLWASMRMALGSVHRAFDPVAEMHAEVDIDPDTDERRVVLDVTVNVPVEELLRQYEEYTRAWVAAVPAEKREWVRLAVHTFRD